MQQLGEFIINTIIMMNKHELEVHEFSNINHDFYTKNDEYFASNE